MKLFVGLGNPGETYARHRHNIGFMALDRIVARGSFGPWRRRFQGYVTEGDLAGERVMLLKPETYMNDSGRAVGEAMRFHKIPVADVIVFHDELDLVPGKIKVKAGGGNAGHNGLRSITSHIGNDYVRVRLGIGHPGAKELVHGYVLHDFARADATWLDALLDAVAEAAPRLAGGDQARFLSEVAHRVGDAAGTASASVAKAKPAPSSAASADRPKSGGGHPAGERMSKRQGALADNLARWLKLRGRSDD
jgi:PTH1 family peptidyl-tRNA hydrolase